MNQYSATPSCFPYRGVLPLSNSILHMKPYSTLHMKVSHFLVNMKQINRKPIISKYNSMQPTVLVNRMLNLSHVHSISRIHSPVHTRLPTRLVHSRGAHSLLLQLQSMFTKKEVKAVRDHRVGESDPISAAGKLYRIFKMDTRGRIDIRSKRPVPAGKSEVKSPTSVLDPRYSTPTEPILTLSSYRFYHLMNQKLRNAVHSYGLIPRIIGNLLYQYRSSRIPYIPSKISFPLIRTPSQWFLPQQFRSFIPMIFTYGTATISPIFKKYLVFLPHTSAGYQAIANKLGLLPVLHSISVEKMLVYGRLGGRGLGEIVPLNSLVPVKSYMDKSYVEVATLCKGWFGRFIIIVIAGVGVIAYYKFYTDTGCIHSDIPHLSHFWNGDYRVPGFNRIVFIEHNSCSKLVEEYISGKDYAFQDMNLPDVIQQKNMINKKNIGIGILVALCIAGGFYHGDLSNIINTVTASELAPPDKGEYIILNHIKCKID